mmetsp:Transcript_35634/g.98741  ORF Transcript_35634/g.98741 Transcript_35634/m.98741 type:complete len:824 (-) Transcript_35634:28-2499(-)
MPRPHLPWASARSSGRRRSHTGKLDSGTRMVRLWMAAVVPLTRGDASGTTSMELRPTIPWGSSNITHSMSAGLEGAPLARGLVLDRRRAEPVETIMLMSEEPQSLRRTQPYLSQLADDRKDFASLRALYTVSDLGEQLEERQAPRREAVVFTGKPEAKSLCSMTYKNCLRTRSCCDELATCYEKNTGWADCRHTCKPGLHEDDQKYMTPWSCRQLDAVVHEWEVLPHGGVKIQSRRTLDAPKLDLKPQGAMLQGLQVGEWLVLDGNSGFAMIWNGGVELLKKARAVKVSHKRASQSGAKKTTSLPRNASTTKRVTTTSTHVTLQSTTPRSAEPEESAVCGAVGHDHGTATNYPPIDLPWFKKCMLNAYASLADAFAALGCADPSEPSWVRGQVGLVPLHVDEFINGTKTFKPPLTDDQARYSFQALDANRDGVLNITEFTGGLECEQFCGAEFEQPSSTQTTTAPTVSKSGFQSDGTGTPQAWSSATFATLDANHDGQLVLSEFQSVGAAHEPALSNPEVAEAFHRLDADGNGKLSIVEFGHYNNASVAIVPSTVSETTTTMTTSLPITMADFKSRMVNAYSSSHKAFGSFGAAPLDRNAFEIGTRTFKPPLTAQQADYAFKGLDADKDNSLLASEFFEVLDLGHFFPTVEELKAARKVRETPSAITTPTPEAGGFLFGLPSIIVVNGILSCLMVPCVGFVGFRICTSVAQDKALRRRTYMALGQRRALVAEVPSTESRLLARRLSVRRQISPRSIEEGHPGYEPHPGVPSQVIDPPARELTRLSPRAMQSASLPAALPVRGGTNPPLARPPPTGKVRTVISL